MISPEKLSTIIGAGTPRESTKLVMAAPAKLPMLHMPCRREMVRSPSCSSTAIPCAFIATSMLAPAMPKHSSASVISKTVGASTTALSTMGKAMPATRHTARLPSFAVSRPASGIAITAPSPLASSVQPSAAASRCSSRARSGTCGTHAPITVPFARKYAATARCAVFARRTAGSVELGILLRVRDFCATRATIRLDPIR